MEDWNIQNYNFPITNPVVDIIHGLVFYLKHSISETGFYLRLQMEPIQSGPMDRASLSLSLSLPGHQQHR
jgi:hypothetical protein